MRKIQSKSYFNLSKFAGYKLLSDFDIDVRIEEIYQPLESVYNSMNREKPNDTQARINVISNRVERLSEVLNKLWFNSREKVVNYPQRLTQLPNLINYILQWATTKLGQTKEYYDRAKENYDREGTYEAKVKMDVFESMVSDIQTLQNNWQKVTAAMTAKGFNNREL